MDPNGGHEKLTAILDNHVPGPGTYTANTSQIYTNLSAKFGSEKRQGMEIRGAEKLPAPNAYDSEAKAVVLRKSPAYGFGVSRRSENELTRGVPGPGTYPLKTIVGTES